MDQQWSAQSFVSPSVAAASRVSLASALFDNKI
jgi:hypothetical protein